MGRSSSASTPTTGIPDQLGGCLPRGIPLPEKARCHPRFLLRADLEPPGRRVSSCTWTASWRLGQRPRRSASTSPATPRPYVDRADAHRRPPTHVFGVRIKRVGSRSLVFIGAVVLSSSSAATRVPPRRSRRPPWRLTKVDAEETGNPRDKPEAESDDLRRLRREGSRGRMDDGVKVAAHPGTRRKPRTNPEAAQARSPRNPDQALDRRPGRWRKPQTRPFVVQETRPAAGDSSGVRR